MDETVRFLDQVIAAIDGLVPCEAGSLLFIERDTDSLRFRALFGKGKNKLVDQRIPLESGICGWVARSGETVHVPDVTRDERFNRTMDSITGFETRCVACVPIKVEGETVAVLEMINPPDGSFSAEQIATLESQAERLGHFLETVRDAGR